jgi:hypothetical protein
MNAFAAQLSQEFSSGGIDKGHICQFHKYVSGIRARENILTTIFQFFDPNRGELSFQDDSGTGLVSNCNPEHIGPFLTLEKQFGFQSRVPVWPY